MAERNALPALCIGVKRGTYRIHDPDADAANAAYVTARHDALQRDRWTCRHCDFASAPAKSAKPGSYEESGFLEIHHLDNNHANNESSNLATVCPFCHEVHHAGNAGHAERATLIWLPEMRHEDLHRLCHALFAAMKLENKWAEDSSAIYGLLAARESKVPEPLRGLKTLGNALARLDDAHYARRCEALGGLRLLPRKSSFDRHIAFWAEKAWASIPDWDQLLSAVDQTALAG
jgi:intracellular multiplication protein IcmJ